MGYSLMRNTNELQDFISDLYSYPVVLRAGFRPVGAPGQTKLWGPPNI